MPGEAVAFCFGIISGSLSVEPAFEAPVFGPNPDIFAPVETACEYSA
jgi:hypothetical protein